MPTVTAPYVEVIHVVTGFMYQLTIAEGENGTGITRMEIGPYQFPGIPPQVKYPEAVTNELCPPGWEAVRWVTDDNGQSFLRWQGGPLYPEDGEMIFQLTSNYPPSNASGATLHVYRGNNRVPERYTVETPDYSQAPPEINPRHDVTGNGTVFTKGSGCLPPLALAIGALAFTVWRAIS